MPRNCCIADPEALRRSVGAAALFVRDVRVRLRGRLSAGRALGGRSLAQLRRHRLGQLHRQRRAHRQRSIAAANYRVQQRFSRFFGQRVHGLGEAFTTQRIIQR